MNIKDLLKNDQGMDVMISGGAGRRDDPYVVEKCVVAESALTQMQLIQGIERGMHEIWRITEWAPCNEGSATEVIRTESVHFTEDKIETTDRALYFDTSDVSGSPYTLHPLVCWRSPDDLIVLPFELGWVHFSGVENNAESSHDFDQTIFFGGLWCKATVYVYSRPPGDDVINMRDAEMMKVTSAIAQTLPDLEDPWPGIEIGPFALKYFRGVVT